MILLTAAATIGCAKAEVLKNDQPKEPEVALPDKVIPKFIHSTYIVGDRLTNQTEISQTNYGKFSFIYLMAAPVLTISDFEQSKENILAKYVTNYSYPASNTGRGLVTSLIGKAQELGSKVLLSQGLHAEFVPIVSDPNKRSKFAAMVAQFVAKFNYDGVEIDWEGGFDLGLHTDLMHDIRVELDKIEIQQTRRLYLTTALAEWRAYNTSQAAALSRSIDWINVMTYDMGGGNWGNSPTHNTPLDRMKSRLENNFRAFSPRKICIGLANYGYQYFGLKPGQTGCNLERDGRSVGYMEVPKWLAAGWSEEWDEVAQAPYYFSPDRKDFASHDNIRSLDAKIEWIVSKGYLGEFWWVFNCDYVPAAAGEKYATNVLIDHVEKRYKELVK